MHRRRKSMRAVLVALTALAFVLTLLLFLPAAGAEGERSDIEIDSSEAVILDTDSIGEIEKVRIINWLSLTGEGEVDVTKENTLGEGLKWQGIHGFTTPVVEGDEIVWRGIDVDRFENVLSSVEFEGEELVTDVSMRIPLELHYEYWFDENPDDEVEPEKISDPEKITGMDGHFRLELTMTNTSAETTEVEVEDPETGEMVTTETEVYLPLVILPYDWYFDDDVFFNLETDPTGVAVRVPNYWQLGWSIPLFPPATDKTHTIWVEADVKDFRMPTLVLSANFIFPETNQSDPIPLFLSGLEQLYDGVKQLHAGLEEGVAGLGDAQTEDTLLYGTNAVLGGLKEMAAGLPEASAALKQDLLPGVDQAVAGIGSPGTPDTLRYAVDQSTVGLMEMVAGIGGPDVANSAIWAMGQMSAGLEEMAAGIGSENTPDTLLYGVDQAASGLQDIKAGIGSASTGETLLYAMNQMGRGLLDMKAGIGSAGVPNTLQYAMAAMQGGLEESLAGIGSASTPDTLLYAMSEMAAGMNEISAGIGSPTTPDTLLYAVDQVMKGVSSGSASDPGILEGLQEIKGGLAGIYDATSPDGEIRQALGLIRLAAIWTGPIVDALEDGIIFSTDPDNPSIHYGCGLMMDGADQLIAGIGSPDVPDTLLYGMNQMAAGLQDIKAGLGGATVPDTLLYAVAQVQGGLEMMKAGIGGATIPDTLLYAVAQVQAGLDQMLAGIGSAVTGDTLLYAVIQVEEGLKEIKRGIGGTNTGDTLLFAMDAMNDGLNKMKEGIGSANAADSLLYAVSEVQGGLEMMKAGIGSEGASDTLLYAMSAVQHGLFELQSGLSSGDLDNPGIKEGLILISNGLGEAVTGLGSASTPDTLIYGADQVNSGVQEVKTGLVQATDEGTAVMQEALVGSLSDLYLTEAQLEAIKVRGDNFDHILGQTEDAVNRLTFIYQTPPTYGYQEGSSWLTGIIIAGVLFLCLLIIGGIMARRRPVIG